MVYTAIDALPRSRIAGITDAIHVKVSLGGVEHQLAIVDIIMHIVPVDIIVAFVAKRILIQIRLVGVWNQRAIIVNILDVVSIDIRINEITDDDRNY
jgi:hypothetical protein